MPQAQQQAGAYNSDKDFEYKSDYRVEPSSAYTYQNYSTNDVYRGAQVDRDQTSNVYRAW